MYAIVTTRTPEQPPTICAWCNPGDPTPGVSHGICPECAKKFKGDSP